MEKCAYCHRFIAQRDIESGAAKTFGEIEYFLLGVSDDRYYICPKCTKREEDQWFEYKLKKNK